MADGQHSFVFSIHGHNVSPSTVGLRDLLEILADFEAVVATTAKSQGAEKQEELQLHLVNVADGSNELTLEATEEMYEASTTLTRAIAENNFTEIPSTAYDALRGLLKRSQSRNWSFVIYSRNNGMVPATIGPDENLQLPNVLAGGTTLLVKVDRAGGQSNPTAQVFLMDGERLTVQLKDAAMADELGHQLFKYVALEGTATWDTETWEIKNFKVDRIGEFEDTPARKAFDYLSEAAGNRWESIDPEEFVAELRSE